MAEVQVQRILYIMLIYNAWRDQHPQPAQVRYLPAELLREVNVVDTPGTNVILSRQQRLTEEYVPRADLVLFVLSADRPFTESEVNFLKYIRRATLPPCLSTGFSCYATQNRAAVRDIIASVART